MKTRLIRSLHDIPPALLGGVVTIGNFDGVHVGHQRLIARLIQRAKDVGGPSIVMTFEPHPNEFFARENLTIPRLTRLREKFSILAACGVDYVLILEFNQEVANISAADFVGQTLLKSIQPKQILVGDDFRFGKNRQGDLSFLQAHAKGARVEALESILFDGERVSSTRVRAALAAGDHELANQLLGRPYAMLGRVRHGDQLGRQLGFRTANIDLHRRLTPVMGVYTVLVHGVDTMPRWGAANVGTRPTVDGTRTLLEVHLLDFDEDIYGRYVQVEFCKKLRNEERYTTLALLKDQITKDVEDTRHYFEQIRRL